MPTPCPPRCAPRRVGEIAQRRDLPRRVLPTLDRPRLAHAAAATILGPSLDPRRLRLDETAAMQLVVARAVSAGVEAEAAVTAEISTTSLMLAAPKYASVASSPSATERLTCRLQIVVERLTKTVNEDHLYEIFGQYGHIKDLDLPISRQCESS